MKKIKSTKPKHNMWQCAGYMISTAWHEKEKKAVILCILQAVCAVAFNLINLYVSPAILSVVENKAPMSQLIVTILIFVGLIAFCFAAINYIGENIFYTRISVRSSLIAKINEKSCITSYPNIKAEDFIKLRSKAQKSTQSNNEATEAVWETLSLLLQNTIGFIIYIVLLSVIDFKLIAVILATTILGYLINKKLNNYGYIHREEEADFQNKHWNLTAVMNDNKSAKDIRIFGLKPWLQDIENNSKKAYRAFITKAENIYIWGRIAELVLSFLRNGIAYIYLIYLVLNNGLSIAEFLLYFSAVGGFTEWIVGILDNMTILYRQSLDISSLMEFLEYPEPFLFENGEKLTIDKNKAYEIKLENVSFKYPSAEKNTLTNINLTLHPGEKLAVVGLNGAGKTTLIKIMCGFLDPTQGKVLLNGYDIRKYNRFDYYKMFSAVFQDFSLLASTIAVNIAQFDENIDMPLVKSCIEKAGLTQKIESLPKKYNSKLNRKVYDDAVELSGGETQRLMLARALYKDSPIIVLDEPTAALDPIAESDMYQKYNEMTNGRSSVYISHRLASTRFCDRIIYIADNCIAEEGTHEELLKLGGKYAELFEVQSKYYREDAVNDEER